MEIEENKPAGRVIVVNLMRTRVRDADLRLVAALREVHGLNLASTAVTDAGQMRAYREKVAPLPIEDTRRLHAELMEKARQAQAGKA